MRKKYIKRAFLVFCGIFSFMPITYSQNIQGQQVINNSDVLNEKVIKQNQEETDNGVTIKDDHYYTYYTIKEGKAYLTHVSSYATRMDGEYSYVIPDNIEYKGNRCPVVKVEKNAFHEGERISEITIGKNMEWIMEEAFQFCRLSSIVIPGNVTFIDKNALPECLKEIVLECGEEDLIWYNANLSSVKKVELDRNIIYNNGYMNGNPTFGNIASLYIGKNVTSIPKYIFSRNKDITSITLPYGIKSIGEEAFLGCGIKSLVIPSSVEIIGQGAFSNPNLESLYIEKGNAESISVGWLPFGQTLKDVFIGRSIKTTRSVYDQMDGKSSPFYGQEQLQRVTVGGDCTRLFYNEFRDCTGLLEVLLQENISVCESPFDGCKAIKKVTVLNPVPPTKNNLEPMFENEVYKNAELFVPEGSIDKYKVADGWKDFFNITATGIQTVTSDRKVCNFDISGKPVSSGHKGFTIEKCMNSGNTIKIIR